MEGQARAYTNIALIKYWGKKDQVLMIPQNNSISLTLDAFYSETRVTFDSHLTTDQFILNDVLRDEKHGKKVFQFLDLMRQHAGITTKAQVISENHVPTAAGLASSASGMAALAGACAVALDLPQDAVSLSRFARRGSGSASRSIYGGFAEWQKGTDDTNSYAVSLKEDLSTWPLAMVFLLVDSQEKKISSRDGMQRTVDTSVFYPGWLATIEKDLTDMRQGIAANDFELVGQTMERNTMKMHATVLGAVPPFTYWQPDSLKAMQLVQEQRAQGLPCYFTMDAGPNVKVLLQQENLKAFLGVARKTFPEDKIVVAFPGKGIQLVKEFNHD